MDLDDLHIFQSVVREGGVTRAAKVLHRVPSNVTTRIKKLEERLGVSLFRREGRALALTDPGKILLGHAERLLQMADMAEVEMLSGVVRGALRLGSLESAAGARLPPILSAFHARYPDVVLNLKTGTTQALLRQMDSYEIEAAFVSEPFERGARSSVPAFEEELVLITTKGWPLVRGPADLKGQTVVAFPHGCSYRQRLIEWLADDGAAPERVLEFGSYHAIVACVAAGTGAGIVPAEVLDHAVLGGAIERHALPAKFSVNRTHLVWTGEASAPLRALMELLPAAARGGDLSILRPEVASPSIAPVPGSTSMAESARSATSA